MERKRSAIAQLPAGKFFTPSEEKKYKEQLAEKSAEKIQQEDERKARKLSFTKELILGLIRMVDGQRQLADEFGLSLSRVFPTSYKLLEGHKTEQVITSMFRSDWTSLPEMSALMNDLILHQVSLMSALDGIAVETLYQMGEEDLLDTKGRINDSRAWRLHKDRVQELLENGNLRFERIVSKGFVEQYIKTIQDQNLPGHKKKRKQKQDAFSNPDSNEEEVVW